MGKRALFSIEVINNVVMKHLRLIFVISFLLTLCVETHAQQRLLGGDISLLPSYEEAGTVYRDEKGRVVKPLEYFKEQG